MLLKVSCENSRSPCQQTLLHHNLSQTRLLTADLSINRDYIVLIISKYLFVSTAMLHYKLYMLNCMQQRQRNVVLPELKPYKQTGLNSPIFFSQFLIFLFQIFVDFKIVICIHCKHEQFNNYGERKRLQIIYYGNRRNNAKVTLELSQWVNPLLLQLTQTIQKTTTKTLFFVIFLHFLGGCIFKLLTKSALLRAHTSSREYSGIRKLRNLYPSEKTTSMNCPLAFSIFLQLLYVFPSYRFGQCSYCSCLVIYSFSFMLNLTNFSNGLFSNNQKLGGSSQRVQGISHLDTTLN
uniref:Transmembrane protein n=1 Tax=Heterorhabditis bacteriophora TaxID=37862 RepID=A0A1I7WNG1_HETBA